MSGFPSPVRVIAIGLLIASATAGGALRPLRSARGDGPEAYLVPQLPSRDDDLSELHSPDEQVPIEINADHAQQWDDGESSVLLLRGRCRITQGSTELTANQMVLWWTAQTTGRGTQEEIRVYLEGNARITRPEGGESHSFLVAQLRTNSGVQYTGRPALRNTPGQQDPVYVAAVQHMGTVQLTSVAQPIAMPVPDIRDAQFGPGPLIPEIDPQLMPLTTPRRRALIVPRNFEGFNVQTKLTDTVPQELVIWVTRGVNIVVEGVPVDIGGQMQVTTLDLTADRAVIWTDPSRFEDMSAGVNIDGGTPFQVYLEGNIVVRQGANTLRASHAFFDVQRERSLTFNTELRVFVPEFEGDIRVRAQQVRQLSRDRFVARDAWATGSQFGKPGYRLQASEMVIERRPGNAYPWIPPDPNNPSGGSTYWLESFDNRFFVGDVPILATPYLTAPVEDPQIPLRRAEFEQDRIFGSQLRTAWNLESIFGLDLPPGTDWNLLADYLSDRGPAIGTEGNYAGQTQVFGVPTLYQGEALGYYINDSGTDNLGLGRRNLPLEYPNRGRALWRNRLRFPDGGWFTSELGYVSDRNFLEQYYEREWDEGKDNETLIYGGQQVDNLTWSAQGSVRLNGFSNVTEWLPRGDLTILSQPLLDDWLTWSSHSMVGYGRLQRAEPPFDPAQDPFRPLPFFPNVDGLVAMTRHELDMPFMVGPVNIVPYVLGEAAYWGQDFTRDDLSRLYGSAGVRASLMMTKAMPWVHSRVFGLNGLAHKMIFDMDYSISEASQDLTSIPQYNQFDDNSQERFRERFVELEFGGVLPPTFESRYYAVRSGAGRSVTDPYHELVDDQQVLRLGWRHRLQTKVGPPHMPRIKDWMTLDLEISYFPDADRDNFGEDFGLFGTQYAWNVGERTRILANSLFDFFDVDQRIWNVGVLSQRSVRGSIYMGFRQVDGGPIQSQIVTASYSYAMSPKWVSSFGTAYDVAEGQNRGQSLTVSRIGGDFIWNFGFGYDNSKNNASLGISVEPRIGHLRTSATQLSTLLGVPTP